MAGFKTEFKRPHVNKSISISTIFQHMHTNTHWKTLWHFFFASKKIASCITTINLNMLVWPGQCIILGNFNAYTCTNKMLQAHQPKNLKFTTIAVRWKKNNIGWRNICIYEKIYHRNKLEGFIHNNYDNKIPGKK